MQHTRTTRPAKQRTPGRRAERLRWWIADQINRLSGQCWSRLVSWALDGPRRCRRRGDNPLPWRPIDDLCRRDAAENDGCCYCRKISPPASGGDPA